MAVTAARLGKAPITMDWAHVLYQQDPDRSQFAPAWEKLRSRFQSKEIGFYDAPTQNEISQAAESQALADSILEEDFVKDCLFLGIGGSALGPKSLLACLQEKCTDRIRFHFVENPDPLEWNATIGHLRPESTLVCIVTKSGTTFETMAQALLALNWLGKNLWKTHVVIITDPVQGDLRKFATEENIPTLSIAPSVGGRFSIFTPVALFPAALAGLSIEAFLNGAREVRDYMEKAPHEKNPVFILSNELIHHFPQRRIHVCMPYSTRLKSIGNWFVQLWGESLGKQGKGFTPLAALGPTDQHSILQLLRDGPDDKLTFFITLDQVEDEVMIPPSPYGKNFSSQQNHFPAFQILRGHTLHELTRIEYQATSHVLTQQMRPHMTFGLDRLDERSLGALYFTFCVGVSFVGTLWEINPFDQPGVEDGKVFIRQALQAKNNA